ncbi:MAG: 2-hydroxyacyl-CoA dehydratase, partial [Desulfatitalea sp.]|nr:2-hydroxyacyl-CoA dehydratase [Desulfatitalea sp.]
MVVPPLMDDGFAGEPAKRVLNYVRQRKLDGAGVVGIYCGYAPIELIQAMGLVPAVLCAFSRVPIDAAETVLPVNLCPLIKSSYGFIIEGTCPFYGLSQAVIAETTCDGKKKMFELIADIKPTHVMDLPQVPDEAEALRNWRQMILRLRAFLEQQFGCRADEDKIEAGLQLANRKNALMQQIFDYAARKPSALHWTEIYDVGFLAQVATGQEMVPILEKLLQRLEKRVGDGLHFGTPNAQRVLVTGCPVGGDATKIFKVIENAGGIVVAPDACTGIKAFAGRFQENSGDPIGAMAERYLKIPCACMTPNQPRLEDLSALI